MPDPNVRFSPVVLRAAAEEPRRCIGPVTHQTTTGGVESGSVPTLLKAVVAALAGGSICARRAACVLLWASLYWERSEGWVGPAFDDIRQEQGS
jgi:hypothetical protein